MAMTMEHPTKFTFPTLFSKFYGSGLPRPYRYFPDDPAKSRVDPPGTVNGALLEWAAEAHWNMGGLNVTRKKLQGKIEGKLDKLDKEQKKRSSSSAKKSSAKRRRQDPDSDAEDERVLKQLEEEDESQEEESEGEEEEEESDEEGGDLEAHEEGEEALEEEEEEDKPSHIRSRTRSGSKKAKERVRKVLQYPDVEGRRDESTKAESSGPAPAKPAGSSRTRQLRKSAVIATPKSRTSAQTRSGTNLRTPASAKSDAKGPARRSARLTPVALPSASSGESDEKTDDERDFSDGSEDEMAGNNEYPATDDEAEIEDF
ncbi:hypothetical protein KFL_003640060 [Klebsormidium nitens]|uniref:Uncharacterized protein n=1 Tax=Klebsormidium nitens TaxID=105231 RepID=A0A1Y1I9F8_KLENI|nr:hypothetical protein KFL_003640060 [Klebsormidium nitens]|eukprot:GAQ87604.1 hypothetical protein KFL_003640060 [Klebsormidium nitens]